MNKQNAHLYLPLIQALAEGKTIECQNTESTWVNSANPSFYRTPECYRIKPEPVMVLLGPEDVPPGSAIRGNAQHWFMVTDMENYGVKVSGRDSLMDWAELQGYWEIKRPGEDWSPCHKTATNNPKA